MNTEEKILNYMDGTLSEGESGELLHSLSVSPEKRVVLEQHIKLRELTALAQKPVSVPQFLESEMADRFPAIAAYNREMAGGAILVKESPSFIGRMAASVAAFVAQYPLRTGFALATASVIGYFSLTSSPEKKVDVASVKPAQMQTAQNIPPSESTSISPKTESYSSKMASAFDNGMNKTYESLKTYKSHKTYAPDEKITHQKQTTPPEESTPPKEQSIADNPGNAIPSANDKKIVENNSVKNTITDIPKKDDAPKAIAENNNQKTDVPPQKKTDAVSDANIGNHGQNPFKNRNEPATTGSIPFAIRGYVAGGQSLVNIHQTDAKLGSHTEGSVLLGIDYVADPHFSIGLEAGQASYSQLATQSSIEQDAAISRVVTANSVTTNRQWYGRAMFRYTFNPYETFRYELSGGGGVALASQLAPVVSFSILGDYTIASHFSISGGLGWSGTWASVNTQSSAATTAASSEPIGYVTVNRASQTLFTPSYSFRAGIIYRP